MRKAGGFWAAAWEASCSSNEKVQVSCFPAWHRQRCQDRPMEIGHRDGWKSAPAKGSAPEEAASPRTGAKEAGGMGERIGNVAGSDSIPLAFHAAGQYR
ncbi:hypothetical protein KM043_000937 [Ampulex compressa]|nr:hypothetical protein KM043_000937 [Ampulex compressa]